MIRLISSKSVSRSRTGENFGWKKISPPVVEDKTPTEATSVYWSGKKNILTPTPLSASSSAVVRQNGSAAVKRLFSLSVLYSVGSSRALSLPRPSVGRPDKKRVI